MVNELALKIRLALNQSLKPLSCFLYDGQLQMYVASSTTAEQLTRNHPERWLGCYSRMSTDSEILADLKHFLGLPDFEAMAGLVAA